MRKIFENSAVHGQLLYASGIDFAGALQEGHDHLKFVWNRSSRRIQLPVDERRLILEPQQLLCCTYLHKIHAGNLPAEFVEQDKLVLLSFNRPFYCIHTNDAEVSCNGLLFFGSSHKPVLQLDAHFQEMLSQTLLEIREELEVVDRNQEEMLRILLKRFIISSTRLARRQLLPGGTSDGQVDLMRHFNALVEEHYKIKRKVSDYAELLHRSPKTIANTFALQGHKAPLQIIQNRVLLEAKRLLLYTDKSIKEIGLELSFESATSFSRFFKKQTGATAQHFRKKNESGSMAHY